jgi:SAM-dependent methyltransferase
MSDQTQRTHDKFYAEEHPLKPKESFKVVADLIKNYRGVNEEKLEIFDIGCATGEFPDYLKNVFSEDRIVGIEYLRGLVNVAKNRYPTIEFFQDSILNEKALKESQANVITVLGVISIFDDIEPIVKNLAKWIKSSGRIFIHGMFNPFPIDVYVKYAHSHDRKNKILESGWNIVSQTTTRELFTENGAKEVIFHNFKIGVDLPPHPNDPVRSWTESLQDGSKQIVNALQIKQPQYIAEIIF